MTSAGAANEQGYQFLLAPPLDVQLLERWTGRPRRIGAAFQRRQQDSARFASRLDLMLIAIT